jgi:ribosomal protein S15P/S13E
MSISHHHSFIRYTLLIALLMNVFQLPAQEDEVDPILIKLKAQVLNMEDEMPVPYAFVMNYRTRSGVTTDDQGRFMMEMLNIDSLAISSLGYIKTTVHIPAKYNEMDVLILYARPVRFALSQVNVKGEKAKVNMDGVPIGEKVDIDPQLRGDAYNEKPPAWAALVNPASFLQYHLSKSEKEKRDTRQAIITEKKWEELSQFYKKELVMELTGLNDAKAEKFMIYFNSKGMLRMLSTEYDVRNAIIEQYEIYKKEGN